MKAPSIAHQQSNFRQEQTWIFHGCDDIFLPTLVLGRHSIKHYLMKKGVCLFNKKKMFV